MNGFIYEKIKQTLLQLEERMVITKTPLTEFMMKECGYKQDNTLPPADEDWHLFGENERWGGVADSHCWFYTKIKTEYENMYLSVATGREGGWDATNPQFIVYLNGKLVQGLDVNHTEVLLKEKGEYEIYLYAYSGMIDEYLDFKPYLVRYDDDTKKLYYDIKVPFDVCALLEENSKEYTDIMTHLENTANLIDFRERGTELYRSSVNSALKYIETNFYKKYCDKKQYPAEAVCIGHTHIDVAWLWTLSQTREKVLRSFSTVLNLMKQYPEYKFMSSQAQLYKYLKEQSPELYEEVREMVRQGRWEVEGAMWVEADCNLTSGESLVRQLLFGKRFFKKEFDVDCKVLWLPDVFGYSAALPQILIKSGVTRFLTSKISWNETNKMPNDTFMWQGIDGTEILSYFLTAQDKVKDREPENYTFYNAMLNPTQMSGAWDRYQNKDLNDEVLVTYGYGDGGGGPTAEMIENGRRLEKGIPGCPSVRFDTAGAFLNKLEKRVKNNKNLPKWVGELYLELHRGTYTSMAKNKRYNRKSEFMYQSAELVSVMASQLSGAAYPQDKLNSGWETILLNQFHDIIPGSSIKEVYRDSEKQYKKLEKDGNEIINAALRHIADNINTDGGILVYNPLSHENSGIAELDGKRIYVENIPPKGFKVIKAYNDTNSVKIRSNSIENRFFRIRFKGADITSIYDKQNKREVIKSGTRANVIQAFEDYPKVYDAWEITSYYKDKMWEVNDIESIEPFDDGICAGLKIKRRFLKSVIEQKICLYDDIPRIDFDTFIDWKQDHILLKALFPVDIHADAATYDIQFGTIERPTHRNTSWDAAKFEVCAHKFADVSEDDYGVSLMNDCKYGYDILGSDMRITLLKSATYPNPDADKCEHRFVYSLYPHKGNHKTGGTISAAYDLNVPMLAVKTDKHSGSIPEEYSLVKCSAENVIVDTAKRAEDSDGIVFRMYEAFNRRTRVRLDFGFDVSRCSLIDLSENELKEIKLDKGGVYIDIKPFEIVSILAE